MKIIFLGLDGVLNVCYGERDEFGQLFHSHFVNNLKHLIDETGAKIVISSSWRYNGLIEMQRMWEHRNLPGEVIDITPCFMKKTGTSLQRGKEIQNWLDNYSINIKNYVILDDDEDMEEHQLNNFVKCSGNKDHEDCIDIGYGLTKICTDKAIEILNRNDAPKKILTAEEAERLMLKRYEEREFKVNNDYQQAMYKTPPPPSDDENERRNLYWRPKKS